MIDRSILKASARLQMAQSEPRCWKVMLVWFLAAILAPSILQSVASNPLDTFYTLLAGGIDPYVAVRVFGGGTAMVGMFLGIVIFLYQIVMSFGLTNYALRLYRGEECGQNSVFEGFSLVGRVIGAQLLVTLFVVLWGLLLVIPLFLVIMLSALVFNSGFGVFVVVAAYVAYIAGVVAISLRYSLTTVALADDPDLGALGAIQRSKDLMRGNQGQYFVLCLSFLGWGLLCGLLVGILTGLFTWGTVSGTVSALSALPGVLRTALISLAGLPVYLWLEPYMQLTIAGFYDTLCPKQPPQYEPLNDYSNF